ncbi:S26 family signal peptidase [Streptomyces ochraceiscleroticus]|uniref:S26 family signal peptidase n=2 Tax=Streptomyces ochraceiscleroticus TaxID=47761 RepID=A0ABW1MJL1_9ACTN
MTGRFGAWKDSGRDRKTNGHDEASAFAGRPGRAGRHLEGPMDTELIRLAPALLRRRLVAVTVRGASMEPAFHDGDRVLVDRGRVAAPGQVVVVERPQEAVRWEARVPEVTERNTAGPMEPGTRRQWHTASPRTIEWDRPPVPPEAGAGTLRRRDWMIKRVAAIPGDPVPRDRVAALTEVPGDQVPPNELVLLGDNQDVSFDSRCVGYFPAERVLGTMVRPLPSPPRPSRTAPVSPSTS